MGFFGAGVFGTGNLQIGNVRDGNFWAGTWGAGRRAAGERGRGVGEIDGFGEHSFPAFIGIGKRIFFFNVGDRLQHELADVGEGGGVASGNAILGEGGEEFAEDKIDVRGSEKVSGEGGGELRAKLLGFGELLLVASVEKAERRMAESAEHAAAAAVGERELAERGIGAIGSTRDRFGAFSGHGSLISMRNLDREIWTCKDTRA